MSKTTKLKEIICYQEGDVKVFVEIDYAYNLISLVEPGATTNIFIGKQYLFKNRGVEFMNGWLNVLEVMKNAIKVAKQMYEKELAVESAFKDNKELEMIVELEKIDKKYKKTK
jgi:hypothetical protein